MTVLEQIDQINDLVSQSTVSAPDVSAWSIGQQIEHCCRVIRVMAAGVKRTLGEPGKTKLTVTGRVIFAAGGIPRGIAKAPHSVIVVEAPPPDKLQKSLDASRHAMKELDPSSMAGYFDHPVLGMLDQKHVSLFLEIHTAHHLAIMRDIVAAS